MKEKIQENDSPYNSFIGVSNESDENMMGIKNRLKTSLKTWKKPQIDYHFLSVKDKII